MSRVEKTQKYIEDLEKQIQEYGQKQIKSGIYAGFYSKYKNYRKS